MKSTTLTKNNDTMMVKNFAINYEESLYDSIHEDVYKIFDEILLMPDTHIGADVPIGFVAQVTDKIIPNVVGVDIGCGMTSITFNSKKELDTNDFEKIDQLIRTKIPSGFTIHEQYDKQHNHFLEKMSFTLEKEDVILKSLGTLGGGNHFIEIGRNFESDLYQYMITVHSGSRSYGAKVNKYHQDKLKFDEEKYEEKLATILKSSDKTTISEQIKKLKSEKKSYKKHYLDGKFFDAYMNDMKLAQEYALLNRKIMSSIIIDYLSTYLDLSDIKSHVCTHNFIDEQNVVRKGATRAYENEPLIIPINMRDGILFGTGTSNKEWLNSAPHGAGRVLRRTEAQKNLSLEEYQNDMQGIYSSCISNETIDESPRAYRSIDEITKAISGNIKGMKIYKPVYNFKGQ